MIVVDWENGAALPNYVQAAANTQLVGKQLARLIQMLNTQHGLDPSDYHLIGFSLGAHIAGFAGAEFRNISRITGLDPASPLFEGYSVRVRLDPTDAQFVDVIHSNGDSFLRGGLGSFQPMGHLDFYPNGGRVQVGCNSVLVGALTDIFYGKWQSLCHHRRAFRFFIDSLVPSCRFHAFACDSYDRFLRGECFACGHSGRRCADMGYFASQARGRGKMYLVTRDAEPFCGEFGFEWRTWFDLIESQFGWTKMFEDNNFSFTFLFLADLKLESQISRSVNSPDLGFCVLVDCPACLSNRCNGQGGLRLTTITRHRQQQQPFELKVK